MVPNQYNAQNIPHEKKNVVSAEFPDGAKDAEITVPGSAGLNTP